jgi:hypothetical protein
MDCLKAGSAVKAELDVVLLTLQQHEFMRLHDGCCDSARSLLIFRPCTCTDCHNSCPDCTNMPDICLVAVPEQVHLPGM